MRKPKPKNKRGTGQSPVKHQSDDNRSYWSNAQVYIPLKQSDE